MNNDLNAVAGLICPVCLDETYSRWGHDYRHCTCGYTAVDGGRNYLRYAWGMDGDTSAGLPEVIYKPLFQWEADDFKKAMEEEKHAEHKKPSKKK